MNKAHKIIITIAFPIIAVLIGFVLIGADDSIELFAWNVNRVPIYSPILYFSKHGYEWSAVVLLITLFELVLWKSPKLNKD